MFRKQERKVTKVDVIDTLVLPDNPSQPGGAVDVIFNFYRQPTTAFLRSIGLTTAYSDLDKSSVAVLAACALIMRRIGGGPISTEFAAIAAECGADLTTPFGFSGPVEPTYTTSAGVTTPLREMPTQHLVNALNRYDEMPGGLRAAIEEELRSPSRK
jgi:hypothetical protein